MLPSDASECRIQDKLIYTIYYDINYSAQMISLCAMISHQQHKHLTDSRKKLQELKFCYK